eukprot:scaffold6503_cov360-Prasinococcus_capsulatus_cf.AAC.5
MVRHNGTWPYVTTLRPTDKAPSTQWMRASCQSAERVRTRGAGHGGNRIIPIAVRPRPMHASAVSTPGTLLGEALLLLVQLSLVEARQPFRGYQLGSLEEQPLLVADVAIHHVNHAGVFRESGPVVVVVAEVLHVNTERHRHQHEVVVRTAQHAHPEPVPAQAGTERATVRAAAVAHVRVVPQPPRSSSTTSAMVRGGRRSAVPAHELSHVLDAHAIPDPRSVAAELVVQAAACGLPRVQLDELLHGGQRAAWPMTAAGHAKEAAQASGRSGAATGGAGRRGTLPRDLLGRGLTHGGGEEERRRAERAIARGQLRVGRVALQKPQVWVLVEEAYSWRATGRGGGGGVAVRCCAAAGRGAAPVRRGIAALVLRAPRAEMTEAALAGHLQTGAGGVGGALQALEDGVGGGGSALPRKQQRRHRHRHQPQRTPRASSAQQPAGLRGLASEGEAPRGGGLTTPEKRSVSDSPGSTDQAAGSALSSQAHSSSSRRRAQGGRIRSSR